MVRTRQGQDCRRRLLSAGFQLHLGSHYRRQESPPVQQKCRTVLRRPGRAADVADCPTAARVLHRPHDPSLHPPPLPCPISLRDTDDRLPPAGTRGSPRPAPRCESAISPFSMLCGGSAALGITCYHVHRYRPLEIPADQSPAEHDSVRGASRLDQRSSVLGHCGIRRGILPAKNGDRAGVVRQFHAAASLAAGHAVLDGTAGGCGLGFADKASGSIPRPPWSMIP